MERRKVLQVTGLALVGLTLGAEAKEEKAKEVFLNRQEMSPKDSKKLEKSELKHTPQITIKEKDAKGYTLIEINIGQGGIIHPSTPNHWIDFIALYADDKRIGKSMLEAEISRGFASFSVKLDGVKVIKAKAGCNLHGIWTSEKTL